jgi:O-antigen ligase
MAKIKNSQSQKSERAIFWLGLFTFLTTIYFNAQTQDPFNAPKFWILILGASWLIGFIAVKLKRDVNLNWGANRNIFLLTGLYLGFSLISALFSQNKFIAFFGENMRKNGYITYFCLALFFLVAVLYIKVENVISIYRFILLTSLAIGIYGIMQMTGNDFIKWSDHGNAVISTLGNSNFAGSMMAILAILCFGGIFIVQISKFERVIALISFLILCITILPTNARQGLLLLVFGIAGIVVISIFRINRKLGITSVSLASIAIVFSILGMLQIGPLTQFLYKDSVSVRGYYWRAGINMLKDHVLFGVGLDNYGSFFKQYREVGYPLKYGYSLTSNNAHNVFIQQFATGGIFVGFVYLVLMAFVFIRGLKGLNQCKDNQRLLVGTFFVAWLAFQAQSIISIDNIGITIWGWVLGGVVVGLSNQSRNEIVAPDSNKAGKKYDTYSLSLLQPTVSIAFGIAAIILVVILNRGESNIYKVRAAFNPAEPTQKSIFYDFANKTINTPLIDYRYKIMTASYLYDMGYKQDGLSLLEKLTKEDKRDLDVLTIISSYYEIEGDITSAIESRKRIIMLDPWNATNYLQLASDYKFTGDKANQKLVLDKVLSFASNDPVVIKAIPELLL